MSGFAAKCVAQFALPTILLGAFFYLEVSYLISLAWMLNVGGDWGW